MGKSKFSDYGKNSKSLKDNYEEWESEGEENNLGQRKKKKSGKRFPRKMTIREKYWEDLPDNDG